MLKGKKTVFLAIIILVFAIIFTASILLFKPNVSKKPNDQATDFKIIDRTITEKIPCDQAFEEFYRDSDYIYEFSCIKSEYIQVQYSDGTKENIKEALKNGKVKIDDLNRFEISYHKKTLDGEEIEETSQREESKKPTLNADEIPSVTIRLFTSIDGGPKQKVITDKVSIKEMVDYWNSVTLYKEVDRPKPGTTLSVLFEGKSKFAINSGLVYFESKYYEASEAVEKQFKKFFDISKETATAVVDNSSASYTQSEEPTENIDTKYSKTQAIDIAFVEAQKRADEHGLVIPDSAKGKYRIELKQKEDKVYYAVVFDYLERKDSGGISAIGIDVDANNGKVIDVHKFK